MLKSFIRTIAIMVFVAGCAKKADDVKVKDTVTNPPPAAPTANPNPKAGEMKAPQPMQPTVAPTDAEAKPETEPKISDAFAPSENYSGAGNDMAVPYFKSVLAGEKSEAQRAANAARAKQVVSAELKRTSPCDHQLTLNLEKLTKSKKVVATTIVLNGASNTKGAAVLKGGSIEGKSIQATAELKCLDQSPTRDCGTTVATIQLTDKKSVTKLIVLFRSSGAKFDIAFPTVEIQDKDYVDLVQLFKNSQFEIHTANALRVFKMDSVEVIGGRSDMKITILSHEHELMLMKMPLIAQESQVMMVTVDTSIAPKEAIEVVGSNPVKTRLAETLVSADMVANDGRGNVTVNVKTKATEALKNFSVISMKFNRVLNPIRF